MGAPGHEGSLDEADAVAPPAAVVARPPDTDDLAFSSGLGGSPSAPASVSAAGAAASGAAVSPSRVDESASRARSVVLGAAESTGLSGPPQAASTSRSPRSRPVARRMNPSSHRPPCSSPARPTGRARSANAVDRNAPARALPGWRRRPAPSSVRGPGGAGAGCPRRTSPRRGPPRDAGRSCRP